MSRHTLAILLTIATTSSSLGLSRSALAQDAPASSPTCPATIADRALAISAPQRIIVMPAEAPNTRVMLSLDTLQGAHREVVWEPGAQGGTSRELMLEPGCWQVSWNIQPLRAQPSSAIDLAWVASTPWQAASSCAANQDPALARVLLGCASFRVQRSAAGTPQTIAQVPLMVLRAPKTSVAQASNRWREMWGGSGLTGTAEQLVAQVPAEQAQLSAANTMQQLSGFVLLKAQDKAMEGARARILKALKCSDGRPFSQTCDLLSIVRLPDLMVISETLQQTLSRDLIQFAHTHLAKRLKMDPVATQVLGSGLDLAASFARSGTKPTDQEIAGTFVAMTGVYADAMQGERPDPVTQGAAFAIAVMSECARQGDCSGKRVTSLVRERDAHFELDDTFELTPVWWPEQDVIAMVGKGLAILRPTQQDASLQRAMALSELTFLLLPKHACARLKAASLEECEAKHPNVFREIKSAQNLIEGAILRDPQRGLLAINDILAADEQQQRMMAALGSLTLQPAISSAQQSGAQASAALANRQQAMETLIKELSRRRARKGDLVFGIHGTTSLNLTAATLPFSSSSGGDVTTQFDNLTPSTSPSQVFAQPINLGFGLNAQKYIRSRIGASLAIDLLEFGRWVSFVDGELNDFDWSSAVYPSATISALFGDPDMPIFAGVRGGYSPLDNSAFVGLNLGIYVTLFDFN